MIIEGVNIEGDLVLRAPSWQVRPYGLDRVRWAWRALLGKPHAMAQEVNVKDCIIGKRVSFEEAES